MVLGLMLADAFSSFWLRHWRAWGLWAMGMTCLGVAVVVAYEGRFAQPILLQLLDGVAKLDVMDFGSPAGWARTFGFGFLLPLAIGFPAAVWASGLLLDEGEELALLLSYPYPRWQVLLGRWLALMVGGMVACVAGSAPLGVWVLLRQGWGVLGVENGLALLLWGMAWANVALCVGLWSGKAWAGRWVAGLGLILIQVVLFVGVGVRWISLLVWFGGVGVFGLGLAFWLFGRRDVGG